MKFVVDGMGGDNAPKAVIEGCIEAIKEFKDVDLYITGNEDILNEELQKYNYDKSRITVVDAKEVITTNEHPAMAVRRKKDSSIVKALHMVKNKECDGIISAGSTGAFLTGCTLIVGRIKGIERPALAPIMPGKNGPFMIVDCGANVDCKPNYLVQFGMMGSVYYKKVMNEAEPTVGLVNIGAEEEKGNDLTKAVYKLLKESNMNFVGNVEPREIPDGDCNVLVCDGFVGNTVLKLYEGTASTLMSMIKQEVKSSFLAKIGVLFMVGPLKNLKSKFDYKEYGGAPFLGVNGVCIKAHGSSDAKAFKNAIRQAKIFHENKVLDTIREELNLLNEIKDEK